MTIYKFPFEKGRDRGSKKTKKSSEKIHHPELIDIEDLQNEALEGEESLSSIHFGPDSLVDVRLPLFIRFIVLAASFVLYFGFVFFLFLFAVFALLGVLSLGRIHAFRDLTSRYWRYAKRLIAIALGLTVAFFSPTLGLGFIALFFGLQGEGVENTFLQHLFRSGSI